MELRSTLSTSITRTICFGTRENTVVQETRLSNSSSRLHTQQKLKTLDFNDTTTGSAGCSYTHTLSLFLLKLQLQLSRQKRRRKIPTTAEALSNTNFNLNTSSDIAFFLFFKEK